MTRSTRDPSFSAGRVARVQAMEYAPSDSLPSMRPARTKSAFEYAYQQTLEIVTARLKRRALAIERHFGSAIPGRDQTRGSNDAHAFPPKLPRISAQYPPPSNARPS